MVCVSVLMSVRADRDLGLVLTACGLVPPEASVLSICKQKYLTLKQVFEQRRSVTQQWW